MTANIQASIKPSYSPQAIAIQMGIPENRRGAEPQSLQPTKDFLPLAGATLELARLKARANGVNLPTGTTIVTSGILNFAIIDGKAKIVGVNAKLNLMQVADAVFGASGLSWKTPNKELVPGVTVRQYLDWRQADKDFSAKGPAGNGSNQQRNLLAVTPERFERGLIKAINLGMYELPPGLQAAEVQRTQQWVAEMDAAKEKRQKGRTCTLFSNVTEATSSNKSKTVGVGTFIRAASGPNESITVAQVKVVQTLSADTIYKNESGRRTLGPEKKTAEAPVFAGVVTPLIFPEGSANPTIKVQTSGSCVFPDNQRIEGTYLPPLNGIIPPARKGDPYTQFVNIPPPKLLP
jgi:hypothetical protein